MRSLRLVRSLVKPASLAGMLVALQLAGCSSDEKPADSPTAGAAGVVAGGASGASGGGGAPTSAGHAGGPSAGGTMAGAASTGGISGGGGGPTLDCDSAGLIWKTARKTWYTSYPDPGSEECIEYNGCMWAGQFAACDDKKTEDWVSKHNIVAAFPGFDELALHDLCLKSGDKTLVVTVLDTCADSDCDGCCTENQGPNDALIDLEKYTNQRWGVEDGPIQWADLGPTQTDGCK